MEKSRKTYIGSFRKNLNYLNNIHMDKIDYKKEYKSLYSCTTSPTIISVPKLKYLSIEGYGDPNNSSDYQDAVSTLFAISYKIMFLSKKEFNINYKVMPLEGLWWTEDMSKFSINDKSNWSWNSLIMQPNHISNELFNKALKEVSKKKKLNSISKVKLIYLNENISAQLLHIGPYSDEPANIQILHKFIRNNGGSFDGLIQKHHEIYLSDFRKTDPSKLKTIIRQPFTK